MDFKHYAYFNVSKYFINVVFFSLMGEIVILNWRCCYAKQVNKKFLQQKTVRY